MKNRTSYKRERRRKFTEKGLCYFCGRERLPDSILCARCYLQKRRGAKQYYDNHRERSIKRIRKNQQTYLEQEKCMYCGVPLLDDEIRMCFACRVTHNQGSIL